MRERGALGARHATTALSIRDVIVTVSFIHSSCENKPTRKQAALEAETNRLRVTLFPETKTVEYAFPSDVVRSRSGGGDADDADDGDGDGDGDDGSVYNNASSGDAGGGGGE